MQGTPVKSFQTKNSSLRAQIQNKLLTDKKLENNKENFKKFHSHVKNVNHNNFFSQSNDQSFQTIQINKNHYENFNQYQPENITIEESLIDQKIILEHESLENPNFFGYQEWESLNRKLFDQVGQKYVKNLWKIMRTINYGDVLIPTGLIYQVFQCLSSKKINKKCSLKEVLNNFLQINNVPDRINNFRELKNYLSFEEIQIGYLCQNSITKKRQSFKNSIYSSLRNTSTEKNVFDRNYEDYKRRNSVKNKQMQKRLLQKQIDPECMFKPKINPYCPQKLFIDEQLRHSRTCLSNENWFFKGLKDNDITQKTNFKATPFQRSRLQCQSLQEIPGAAQHIDRYKNSEAKRRKLNRYNQRPTQVLRNY